MSKKKKSAPAAAAPAPANRKLQHMGYTIVQSARNHHIMIGKDGKAVKHIAAYRPFTDHELREVVDEYHYKIPIGGGNG